ncbi:MAG: polysaccharide deacetylase family protein, partial [Candidatus Hodarchaeales archaeon]
MVNFILCIDVDRDAPFPVKGIPHAVSLPLQNRPGITGESPWKAATIKGTMEGMSLLLPLLNDKNINPVLFHEARTLDMIRKENPRLFRKITNDSFQHGLHGVDHEDYSGKLTGIQLERSVKESLLKKGIEIVSECVNEKITLFRAPYMEQDSDLLDILVENGITQDSSEYLESTFAIYPRRKGDLIEFPVIKTPRDEFFKGMYTYLWPFFEGKRSIEEIISIYTKLANTEKEK